MPFPIQMIRDEVSYDKKDNISLYNSDYLSSILDIKSDKDANSRRYRASDRERSLLLDIWNNNDKNIISAQKLSGIEDNNIMFRVPSDMSLIDITKLSNVGLIKKVDNGMIQLTDTGRIALSREIMNQPSEILKERKRDKFVFSEI